jgi:hypothetical protein
MHKPTELQDKIMEAEAAPTQKKKTSPQMGSKK